MRYSSTIAMAASTSFSSLSATLAQATTYLTRSLITRYSAATLRPSSLWRRTSLPSSGLPGSPLNLSGALAPRARPWHSRSSRRTMTRTTHCSPCEVREPTWVTPVASQFPHIPPPRPDYSSPVSIISSHSRPSYNGWLPTHEVNSPAEMSHSFFIWAATAMRFTMQGRPPAQFPS